jgi:hypothetical protein
MATNPDSPRPSSQETPALILFAGTLVGLILVGVGFYLTMRWWGTFTTGMEEWRKNWWQIALCFATVFGGLGTMFAALNLARGEERTNPSLRRLIYGYNAVLTGLLLLAILGVVNLLAYVPFKPFSYFNQTYDWTEANLYTLHPDSKAFLQKLEKPVKVFVILPEEFFVTREVHTLMDNVKAATNKVEVEYLSPDLNWATVEGLMKKYDMPEREGLLLLYGTEPDVASEFIKIDELTNRQFNMGADEKAHVEFKGENALIGKLSYLTEGKSKPKVYVTQGNGELELNNLDTSKIDVGMGLLRDRLARTNYDIQELKLDATTDKVPDDAGIVVVARPTKPLPPAAVAALEKYMQGGAEAKKKGKMIVLLDVVRSLDGGMLQTGLEPLLAQYGVQPGNERIGCLQMRDPTVVPAVANPRANTPLATKYEGNLIPFRTARPVRPAATNPQAGSPYTVETILQAPTNFGVWLESNMEADMAARAAALRKMMATDVAELRKQLSPEDVPLVVAVSEAGPPPPPTGDPHEGLKPRAQEPRLVVFGDTSWISNREMTSPELFDLFTGSLAWLRGRTDVGALAEPKDRKAFLIKKDKDEVYWRLFFIPAGLITLGIVGLGAGVWVVRRR